MVGSARSAAPRARATRMLSYQGSRASLRVYFLVVEFETRQLRPELRDLAGARSGRDIRSEMRETVGHEQERRLARVPFAVRFIEVIGVSGIDYGRVLKKPFPGALA